MTKIIVVDDHSLFREGVKLLIENDHLGCVIAEAENGSAFLDLLNTHQPDLVIMDIEMPVMGGLEAMRKALMLKPNLRFLVLTMLNDKVNYNEIIFAGAMGFVLKTAGKKEFERAINTIKEGESYFSPDTLRQLLISSRNNQSDEQSVKKIHFSDRELEVLKHLCNGLSVSEIADKIFLSVKTVEAHRSSLLRKTNARNTINLVLYAIKNKMAVI